jgi:hypothetical protein
MTDRLTDLLADAATGADSAPPTRAGVETAIGHRRKRRRRQRAAGSALAALCLVAGVAGGLALAQGDDDDPVVEQPSGPLPPVPLVGIDLEGFELTEASVEPAPQDLGSPPTSFVTFREEGSLAGPLVTVAVDPGFGDQVPVEPDGEPVDLDGDGRTDGALDGHVTSTRAGGVAVTWTLEDGQTAGVGGYGLSEEQVLDYASTIHGGDLDPVSVPAPDGLPDRTTATVPSGLDTEQARVTYRDGGREIDITTTNEPGWFDLVQAYALSTYGGFEAADVGDTFLGSARAVISEPRPGYGYAIVRTESGLTVELATDGGPTSPDELRDLLAAGRLVELDPDDLPTAEPTSTTAVATATTLPAATTSMVRPTTSPPPGGQRVPTFDREHLGTGTSIQMTFGADPIEFVETPADTAEAPPYCPNPAGLEYERYFVVDVVFAAAVDGGLVYDDGDVGLWWCAEAETTVVAIGHAASQTPTARSVTAPHGVVVDLAG